MTLSVSSYFEPLFRDEQTCVSDVFPSPCPRFSDIRYITFRFSVRPCVLLNTGPILEFRGLKGWKYFTNPLRFLNGESSNELEGFLGQPGARYDPRQTFYLLILAEFRKQIAWCY